MIDNPRAPRVRRVAQLLRKAGRRATGLFVLEGPQAVGEALADRPELVVEVFAVEAVLERFPAIAAARPTLVSERVLAAMADTVAPQGVVAVARQFPTSLRDVLAARPRLVAVLEEIRDPGNAGTILRVADAAGADAVIFTGDTVDLYNPKVVRSTTGSLFHVPHVVGADLAEVCAGLRAAGLQVLAADVSGEELTPGGARGVLAAPTAWVFGNEAHGLDAARLALTDRAFRLPIYGRAESLNLATAASVCLYESAFAQRGDESAPR